MIKLTPKQNRCELNFKCLSSDCVYKTEENGKCKFNDKGECKSVVAQVNRCVLFLKYQRVWSSYSNNNNNNLQEN